MPQVQTAESGSFRLYRKAAGDEPLPGYKLTSPLGRGGFGEVWKCIAPGGLQKAIKFVTSESEDGRGHERFGQELAAFEQIRAIRHPFLLTLERVEHIGNDLIMVMELADRQLQDRFRECRVCGLPGIPRDELLAYFADIAEALDVISAKFGLQHLDVKPANLFLVSGHGKVGDYGLVAQLEGPEARNRGLTPRYVAPEVLHGTPSKNSDQYSLALVYHELLTGDFPFPGKTPQQLMLQHVSGLPILNGLPPADRPVVAKALAKRPDERFASCLEFVQALMASGADTSMPVAALNIRKARVDRSVAEMSREAVGDDYSDAAASVDQQGDSTHSSRAEPAQELTQDATLPGKPSLTVPGNQRGPLPPLISGNIRRLNTQRTVPQANPKPQPGAPPQPASHQSVIVTPPPGLISTPAPRSEALPPIAEEVAEAGLVVLERIRSVVPVAALIGMEPAEQPIDALSFAAAVVQAAAGGGQAPQVTNDVGRFADGTWVCRFPSTVPASVVPLKLNVMQERWGMTVEQPDTVRIVLRRTMGGGGFFSGRKYGYELTLLLPASGKPLGEVTVMGRVFGTTDTRFMREAADVLPKMLGDVRGQLANVQDRRRHPRVACELPVSLFPLHSDGGVDEVIQAVCRDASLGGLGLHKGTSLKTKYAYAAFSDIPVIAGQAILLRLIRTHGLSGTRFYGTQFRTDL
jgi:serine/threonine protein kinase